MILSALPRVKGIIILIIVSCLFCSSRAMAENTVAGTVKTVSGLVEIQRDADVFSARTGTEVMGQDILVTGVTGYAGIQFTDDTVITLGPGEEKEAYIACGFEPDRVLVDPDARVLQLERRKALQHLTM